MQRFDLVSATEPDRESPAILVLFDVNYAVNSEIVDSAAGRNWLEFDSRWELDRWLVEDGTNVPHQQQLGIVRKTSPDPRSGAITLAWIL